MNRKDGGKGGRTREGESPQLEPGRKLPGTGARRRQARLEARRNGGKEEAGKAGSKEEAGKAGKAGGKEKRGQGGGDFRSLLG